MLITVLYRLDGEENGSGGGTWYSAAVDWPGPKGISDGACLDDAVTREQLVTMLYRTREARRAAPAAEFPDAGGVISLGGGRRGLGGERRTAHRQGRRTAGAPGQRDPRGRSLKSHAVYPRTAAVRTQAAGLDWKAQGAGARGPAPRRHSEDNIGKEGKCFETIGNRDWPCCWRS